MTEHSKYFAPSTLSRRIACPGSATLEAELPDVPYEPGEKAAREGSAMHHVCERCQTSGGEPQDWVGKKAPVEEGDGKVVSIKIDPDMVKCCDRALAMIREITEGRAVETEKRLAMPDLPDMFGTVDVLVNDPPLLIVCDYKFGHHEVKVEMNAQLMAYALMAAGIRLDDYEDIRLVVIQPTVRDENGEPKERCEPKVCKVSPKALARWRDETLMPAVDSIQRAVQGGKPEYRRDRKACAWCKGYRNKDEHHKPVCPAYAEADRNRPA